MSQLLFKIIISRCCVWYLIKGNGNVMSYKFSPWGLKLYIMGEGVIYFLSHSGNSYKNLWLNVRNGGYWICWYLPLIGGLWECFLRGENQAKESLKKTLYLSESISITCWVFNEYFQTLYDMFTESKTKRKKKKKIITRLQNWPLEITKSDTWFFFWWWWMHPLNDNEQ